MTSVIKTASLSSIRINSLPNKLHCYRSIRIFAFSCSLFLSLTQFFIVVCVSNAIWIIFLGTRSNETTEHSQDSTERLVVKTFRLIYFVHKQLLFYSYTNWRVGLVAYIWNICAPSWMFPQTVTVFLFSVRCTTTLSILSSRISIPSAPPPQKTFMFLLPYFITITLPVTLTRNAGNKIIQFFAHWRYDC
jgi:hypothetical protein